MVVKLSDIVEKMQMQPLDGGVYLNRTTGETVLLTEEEIMAAESDDDVEQGFFKPEQLELVRQILEDEEEGGKDFARLPDKREIHEYRFMREFIQTVEDERTYRILSSAITGSGAFRRFKDCADEFDVLDDWYEYRDERYREIAADWCETNEIEFVDDTDKAS